MGFFLWACVLVACVDVLDVRVDVLDVRVCWWTYWTCGWTCGCVGGRTGRAGGRWLITLKYTSKKRVKSVTLYPFSLVIGGS